MTVSLRLQGGACARTALQTERMSRMCPLYVPDMSLYCGALRRIIGLKEQRGYETLVRIFRTPPNIYVCMYVCVCVFVCVRVCVCACVRVIYVMCVIRKHIDLVRA